MKLWIKAQKKIGRRFSPNRSSDRYNYMNMIKKLEDIFMLLDSDQDGKISSQKINLKALPI